ncbi:hypothetical protein BDW67DRAFT_22540 [Aspergillus spinulosporus]
MGSLVYCNTWLLFHLNRHPTGMPCCKILTRWPWFVLAAGLSSVFFDAHEHNPDNSSRLNRLFRHLSPCSFVAILALVLPSAPSLPNRDMPLRDLSGQQCDLNPILFPFRIINRSCPIFHRTLRG